MGTKNTVQCELRVFFQHDLPSLSYIKEMAVKYLLGTIRWDSLNQRRIDKI